MNKTLHSINRKHFKLSLLFLPCNGDTIMDIEDEYKKLGVRQDSSVEDIKRAYHKKALELHPDKSIKDAKIADAEFKEINNAYHEVMNDKKKSAEEDTNSHKYTKSNSKNAFYTETNMNSDNFRVFNFIQQLFPDLMSNSDKFYPRSTMFSNSRPNYENYRINSCPGGHDRFTICLKCKNY